MTLPIRIRPGAGDQSGTKYRTFCCYGNTRCGKTQFAATFPNPVFISDMSERGWVTLENMNVQDFYYPDREIVIVPVGDQAQVTIAMQHVEQWVRQGYFDTVVFDSLTFYAESWFNDQHQKMARAGTIDTRALYGAMAQHLSNLRTQVHKWPCNVVWTALASPPADKEEGGPMLSGKSKFRFAAGCDHIFYHRKYQHQFQDEPAEDGTVPAPYEATVFEVVTRNMPGYVVGGRDNGKIPDVVHYPTYRYIAECLGITEFAPRPALPDVLYEAARAALDKAPKAGGAPTAAPATAAAATTPQAKASSTPPARARAR
jgi:hypothetical protein